MRSTAFTIGAGHMNALEFFFRVTDGLTKGDSIVQVFLVSGAADATEHGQLGVKMVKRLLVSHGPAKIQTANGNAED